MGKPVNLFYAPSLNGVYDRANPIDGTFGLKQERPVAFLPREHTTDEERRRLGSVFAASLLLLEVAEKAHAQLTSDPCEVTDYDRTALQIELEAAIAMAKAE